MKVIVKETGQVLLMSLYEPNSTVNIASKFAKKHLGLKADKPAREKGVKEYTLSAIVVPDLRDILKLAQVNMGYPEIFNNMQIEQVHNLIRSDVKKAWKNSDWVGYDRFFAVKNAIRAERDVWLRLITGRVEVKPTLEEGGTADIEITDFRHAPVDDGDTWVLRVKSYFVMRMPNPRDNQDFTAAMELHYKRAAGQEDIELVHEEWLFPFSMSAEQEDVVIGTLLRGAEKRLQEEAR